MQRVRADQLIAGDVVDFTGDQYVDPGSVSRILRREYAEVVSRGLEDLGLRLWLKVGNINELFQIVLPASHQVKLEMHTTDVDGKPWTVELPEHVDYPHQPGRLHDCPACEARCWCDSDPGSTECVYSGANGHDWSWIRAGAS